MNKKKIVCYWSPFIDNVATVKSVLNSALSINLYSNKKYESLIIDVFGEWKSNFNKEISNLKFYSLNYIESLFKFSSKGFIRSRIKYLIIFLFSFNSLKKFLLSNKPDFLVVHLVTSLPLFLNLIYQLDLKIILRISGKPKMNIFRYLFWKISLKKIYRVTFPTQESLDYFKSLKIVDEKKLFLLRDPVFIIKDINKKKKESIDDEFKIKKNDYYLSIGRLTKQKNFIFLIKCFSKIINEKNNIKLAIIGVGEDKDKIERLIKKNNLEKNIILLGFKKNVYKYLYNCKAFILSSLWEDPGFVLIEAMVSDCLVLSSNCSNGPKEIVENKNGLLFESNSENDFILKFHQLIQLNDYELNKFKVNAKKKIRDYSIFQHFKEFNKII
ncbi:glycosyltransferase [Candidatus Pelagibacter sp.]|nr:glycosyltransferase [Candidatus Pelagibacter sp.]